jgi:hypothetical protein
MKSKKHMNEETTIKHKINFCIAMEIGNYGEQMINYDALSDLEINKQFEEYIELFN